MTTKQRPELVRFEEKFKRAGETECWEWTAYVCPQTGYGRFGDSNKVEGAHRVSYRLYKGDPTGKVVRHTCDNRKCVNPNHLLVGSHQDNMKDMADRGRSGNLGEKSWSAKLTEQDIIEIRTRRGDGERLKDICRDYDITPQQCSSICVGRYWSHVGGPVTRRALISKETKLAIILDIEAGVTRRECQQKYNISKAAVQVIAAEGC